MTRPPALLHVFSTFAVGGQQTRFATIANRLGPGYRHHIISLDGRDAAMTLLDPALGATLERGVPGWRSIADRLRTTDPDVLITYNWGAIEWAIANRLSRRLPHLHFEDGFGPEEADRQKRRRVLTRALVLRRSAVVVCARNLERIAVAQWHLPSRRVHYIPNGIDATRFDTAPRDGAGFFTRRDGECVIGSFSPLRAEKNIGRLLAALAPLAGSGLPVRLVICGDGPERDRLEAAALSIGITDRVTFTGHVPGPEAVLGAFDILALTSDTEQMPYAVLEAMAARLPVLATDVGDIALMVSAENRRFVLPRDDAAALADACRQLVGDPDLRRTIGGENRRKVESAFSVDRMVDDFRHLFDAALRRAPAQECTSARGAGDGR